jgi:molybdate-binding protein
MGANQVERLSAFEQIKLLADKRRLSILRHLMASPASLTQLGHVLGQHPAWVRHHLLRLEQAGLVEIAGTREVNGAVEKIYRARANAFLLQEMILPEQSNIPSAVFSGSHDMAIELLAAELADQLNLTVLPIGSLDGLLALRQGLCHLSGCHLLDPGGEYNLPYIRHFFPDRITLVMTLAQREQGLMTAPGNPKSIRGMFDLAREDVVFINRNAGSGTRIWLDQKLHSLGIPPAAVRGYGTTTSTHTESARRVERGEADLALGLHAAAHQFGLHFIPLFQERYDIVLPEEQVGMLHPLLDSLQTSHIRQALKSLPGYDVTHTGEQIPL